MAHLANSSLRKASGTFSWPSSKGSLASVVASFNTSLKSKSKNGLHRKKA